MSKLRYLWCWIIFAALIGCSADMAVVKKDGAGNVLISKEFINSIENSQVGQPIYYSSDSSWLIRKQLTAHVWELEDYSTDYWQAVEVADSDFWIFQAQVDSRDNLETVMWSAYISDKPALRLLFLKLLNENFLAPASQNNRQEAIAGLPISSDVYPTQFFIQAVRLDAGHDRYYNADERYALDSRYIVSWDRRAMPQVDFIRQYNFGNKLLPSTDTVSVPYGANEVVMDIRRGRHFELCWRGIGNIIHTLKVDPLRTGDIILNGLELYQYGGNYLFNIVASQNQFDKSDDNWSRLRLMRYAKLENYKTNGFIRVRTVDLLGDEHRRAREYYVNIGAVGYNPKNLQVQESFLTDPELLRKLDVKLYEKYKNTIQIPK